MARLTGPGTGLIRLSVDIPDDLDAELNLWVARAGCPKTTFVRHLLAWVMTRPEVRDDVAVAARDERIAGASPAA